MPAARTFSEKEMVLMTHLTKAAAVLSALILSIALGACGSDSGDSDTTTATDTSRTTTTSNDQREKPKAPKPTIVIRNGAPVGGVKELDYNAGDQIHFTVRSDVADEVHVHGYDLAKDVPAGGSVSFSFLADIEGIFEVELEERVEQIAELTVNP
jgi:hypothetical protein